MSPVASDTENTDVDSTPLNIQTPNVDKQEEKNGKEGEEEGETAGKLKLIYKYLGCIK